MANVRFFENTNHAVTKKSDYESTLEEIQGSYRPSLPKRSDSIHFKKGSPEDPVVDARNSTEKEREEGFYLTRKRSAEALEEHSFTLKPQSSAIVLKSFHPVDKVLHKGKLWFFKKNVVNSVMSELETTAGRFYYLFSRHLTPKVRTVYNDTLQITGVASKGMIDFKTLQEDPLQLEDITIEALDNKTVTLDDLLKIYEQYSQQPDFNLAQKPDNTLLSFSLSHKIVSIKASDLKHFEIIRGNAITLTLSYFFEEDDLHCGNLAKDGKRIDFDMSLWSLFAYFKNAGLSQIVDRTARSPFANQFDLSEKDIQDLPMLSNATPFHWPILSKEGYAKWALRFVGRLFPSTTSNAYKPEMQTIYAQFSKNPVFIHYKYEVFLQLCTLPHAAYLAIAEVEINNEVKLPQHTTPINQDITQHLKKRTERCRELLSHMAEFRAFIKDHGGTALDSFINELKTYNEKINTRITKRSHDDAHFEAIYPEFIKQQIDLEEVKNNFDELKKQCESVSQIDQREKRRLGAKNFSF